MGDDEFDLQSGTFYMAAPPPPQRPEREILDDEPRSVE